MTCHCKYCPEKCPDGLAAEGGTFNDGALPPWPTTELPMLNCPKYQSNPNRLVVILVHFNKTGLDVNLRRHLDSMTSNRIFYRVQILLVARTKKFAQAVIEKNAFPGGSNPRPMW